MASVPRHDRRFLLMGAKRNAELELQEIERYGIDSYGDADWVSVYGLRPAEWYARGVRMLGRTAVECTRDRLGDVIGRHVATVVRQPSPLVVDLFAGSGNTLYWLLRHLPRARGVGFEIDPVVFALTRDNLGPGLARRHPERRLRLRPRRRAGVRGAAPGRFHRPALGRGPRPDERPRSPTHHALHHRDPGRHRSRNQREPAPLCHSGARTACSWPPRRGADALRLVGAADLPPERAR